MRRVERLADGRPLGVALPECGGGHQERLLSLASVLAARGVPPEFVRRATEKVAGINAAWDRIKRERGL